MDEMKEKMREFEKTLRERENDKPFLIRNLDDVREYIKLYGDKFDKKVMVVTPSKYRRSNEGFYIKDDYENEVNFLNGVGIDLEYSNCKEKVRISYFQDKYINPEVVDHDIDNISNCYVKVCIPRFPGPYYVQDWVYLPALRENNVITAKI